jgi:hypothetical protein
MKVNAMAHNHTNPSCVAAADGTDPRPARARTNPLTGSREG